MLVFLINRTRSGLTPEQYGRLAELAKAFYANIPPGVTLQGEWAAADYSRNFSLLRHRTSRPSRSWRLRSASSSTWTWCRSTPSRAGPPAETSAAG